MRLSDHFSGAKRDLADAAASGRVAEVARLVTEKGVDPNALSAQGMPLLLWAVHAGSVAGFEALLANGADANGRASSGELLMHYVIESGGAPYVRAAIRHRLDLNLQNRDREPLTHIARRAGDWDSVSALVEAGADVDAPGAGLPDNTLLSIATGMGDFKHALWLLQNGADPGIRIADALAKEVIGSQPILEDIFHRPMSDGEPFAEARDYQQRCRQWVLEKGYAEPAMPRRFATVQ